MTRDGETRKDQNDRRQSAVERVLAEEFDILGASWVLCYEGVADLESGESAGFYLVDGDGCAAVHVGMLEIAKSDMLSQMTGGK